MGFNVNKFTKQKFEQRTETISVPALVDWFDAGTEPEWVVKNLTGNELSKAQEAAAKNKNIAALSEALVGSDQADKIKALRKIIGNSDDVCADLAKRIEIFVSGSLEPKVDHAIAVKIAEHFPIEFMQITGKISILTGMGASKAKPMPSGKTLPSEGV